MRRNPHRPFDPDLLSTFVEGRTISSARLLSGGRRNSNYAVTLHDGLKCVVRLYAQGGPGKEIGALELARAVVPVQQVLATGDDWAVLSWLEGRPLSEVPDATASAAEAIACISTIRLESSGWITPSKDVHPFSFAGGLGFIRQKLSSPQVAAHLGPSSLQRVTHIVRRSEARLKVMDAQSCLVHGDFNPSNVLVGGGTVSGIVDWEFSHSGSPWLDIGNLLRHTDSPRHRDIEAGLRTGGFDLPDDWTTWARLADLSAHLEFLDSDSPEDQVKRSLRWLGRFLRQAGGE